MEEANYNKITDTKIKLLKYGIKFEPVDLFNKFYNIDKYSYITLMKARKINIKLKIKILD